MQVILLPQSLSLPHDLSLSSHARAHARQRAHSFDPGSCSLALLPSHSFICSPVQILSGSRRVTPLWRNPAFGWWPESFGWRPESFGQGFASAGACRESFRDGFERADACCREWCHMSESCVGDCLIARSCTGDFSDCLCIISR